MTAMPTSRRFSVPFIVLAGGLGLAAALCLSSPTPGANNGAAPTAAGAPGAPAWANPATVPGNEQVTLNWLPAGGGVTGYCLRYRTSNSSEKWTEVANLPVSSTTYTVKDLTNLKSYEFQVGATQVGGAAAWNDNFHARPRGPSHPSGLHAGGQINAIAKAGEGIMVAGGDVSGFRRSLDGGETWFQSSRGLVKAPGSKTVCSLLYHGATGTLYGACSGCFYKSMDNGATWALCNHGAAIDIKSTGHVYPRTVGKLIAVDPANVNTVYIGTLKGLIKSVDGGAHWTTVALGGKVLRGLAFDKGFIYAAGPDGVCRCSPSGEVTLFNGAGASKKPEEILALGGNLYVAANTDGIVRLENPSTAAADAAWTNLNVGSETAKWGAIDGYVRDGAHVIVVGNASPDQLPNGRCTTVMKCLNAQAPSGFKWVNISSADTTVVKITLAAGNGETWWRIDPTKGVGVGNSWAAAKRLDGNVFAIDQILIDRENTNKIHAAGQMGIWRTLDGGATWEPAGIGLGAAVHNCVAVDPSHPGYVYVGDTDNGLWVSHDHAESVAYCTRPTVAKTSVNDVAVDPTNGFVYAVCNNVLWGHDPARRSWSQPKGPDGKTIEAATGDKAARGVGAGRASGSPVVLAAVPGSGIWRMAEGGGPLVYFCDSRTGVWRSRDAGQNWTLIWNKAPGGNAGGGIAVTSDRTKLFVATNEGVCRLDHADTGDPVGSPSNAIVVTNLGGPKGGLLAAQGRTVWASGEATPSGTKDVVLWKSTDGATFTPFPDIYYERAAGFATGLAAEAGFQYTSAGSLGSIVSER